MTRCFPVLGAFLLLATGLLAGCGSSSGRSSGDARSLVVGAVVDVTGSAAAIGGPERDALQLAADQINESGGINGRKVTLTVLDAKSDVAESAKDATSLLTDKHVDVVIGSSRSAPSLAMRPVVERARVPMVSLAAAQSIIEGSHWVFKMPPSDSVVFAQLVDYFHHQGFHRIGLLRDASALGDGVDQLIDKAGSPYGISTATVEKFDAADVDFTAQLVALRSAHTDANVIYGSGASIALATKQYRQLALTAPLIHSYGAATSTFLQLAGTAADGVILNGNRQLIVDSLRASDPTKAVIEKFSTAFQKRYGRPPTPFAGYAYDAVNLVAAACRQGSCSPAALRDQLERITDFQGVTGTYDFSAADHSGLPKSPLVMLRVQDGHFEPLPASP